MQVINPKIIVEPSGLLNRLFGKKYKVFLECQVEVTTNNVRGCEEEEIKVKYFSDKEINKIKKHIQSIKKIVLNKKIDVFNSTELKL